MFVPNLTHSSSRNKNQNSNLPSRIQLRSLRSARRAGMGTRASNSRKVARLERCTGAAPVSAGMHSPWIEAASKHWTYCKAAYLSPFQNPVSYLPLHEYKLCACVLSATPWSHAFRKKHGWQLKDGCFLLNDSYQPTQTRTRTEQEKDSGLYTRRRTMCT